MEFEWDERKRKSNLKKHKIDLADAEIVFAGMIITIPDDREDYGEDRFILLCPFVGKIYHVTFTWRGDRIRLISARRANWKEVQDYEAG